MIKNILSGVNSFVNRLAFAIVLILIFAIFIYPLFSGGKEVKRVENQMEKIGTALESYYAEKGSWPSSGTSNIGVIFKDSVSQKDPWGKEYRYFFSNDGYAIQSSGPDKVFAEGQKFGKDDHWYSKSLRQKR